MLQGFVSICCFSVEVSYQAQLFPTVLGQDGVARFPPRRSLPGYASISTQSNTVGGEVDRTHA